MTTKEAYKQKIEAELELAQAKLAQLKAQVKSATADVRIQSAKQVDELEKRRDAARARLKEVGEASSDAWERVRNEMENARDALREVVQDRTRQSKE